MTPEEKQLIYVNQLIPHRFKLTEYIRYLSKQKKHLVEDIVQETYRKAFENIDQFKPGTKVYAWLSTIARNTYFDYLKNANNELLDIEDIPPMPEASTQDGQPEHVDKELLHMALEILSHEERHIITLFYLQSYSYNEIAEALHLKPGHVRLISHRARKRLFEFMKGKIDK